MALKDRRRAKAEQTNPVDREVQGHLQVALKEIDRAMAVYGRISRSARQEDQQVAGRARQNRAILEAAKAQLSRVTNLKAALEQDIDLLPETVREQLSREASLKRRAEDDAKRRQRQTEESVQNLLASLGKGASGAAAE